MIINQSFLEMLQLSAKINTSVAILPGDRLRTINAGRSHVFSGKYPEDVNVNKEFYIYDLNDFIRAVKLVGTPCNVEIDGYKAVLHGENRTLTYFGCDSQLIETILKEDPKMPSVDASVALPSMIIKDAVTAAKTLSCTHITFTSKDGVQTIDVSSIDIDGSPSMNFVVGADPECKDFSFNVPTEVFNVPPDDFLLQYCKKGLAVFKNEDEAIHAIGVEPSTETNEG